MHEALNVHTYDGAINITRLPDLALIYHFPLLTKRERGKELIETARASKMNDISLKFLEDIVESIGTLSNVDNTNGLIADDLICICWTHRFNKEFIAALETQLLDMMTGFCPQGRTHRLFQLLVAFA